MALEEPVARREQGLLQLMKNSLVSREQMDPGGTMPAGVPGPYLTLLLAKCFADISSFSSHCILFRSDMGCCHICFWYSRFLDDVCLQPAVQLAPRAHDVQRVSSVLQKSRGLW